MLGEKKKHLSSIFFHCASENSKPRMQQEWSVGPEPWYSPQERAAGHPIRPGWGTPFTGKPPPPASSGHTLPDPRASHTLLLLLGKRNWPVH